MDYQFGIAYVMVITGREIVEVDPDGIVVYAHNRLKPVPMGRFDLVRILSRLWPKSLRDVIRDGYARDLGRIR